MAVLTKNLSLGRQHPAHEETAESVRNVVSVAENLATVAFESSNSVNDFLEYVTAVVSVTGIDLPQVIEDLETVADLTKYVCFVGAAFQITAFGVQCAGMIVEDISGQKVMPKLHSAIIGLATVSSKSVMRVLDLNAGMEEIRRRKVIAFKDEGEQAFFKIENHLMQRRIINILSSKRVSQMDENDLQLTERMSEIMTQSTLLS